MGSGENAAEVVTAVSDIQSADEKEEAEKHMDSFQDWVITGSSWFRSAKEKTYTTLELVKKDLTELSDVVASEASALANTAVESVKQQSYNLQQIMNLEESDKQHNEESQKLESDVGESEQSSLVYGGGWVLKLPSMPAIADHSWIKAIVHTVKNIAQENTTENEDEFTESIHSQIRNAGEIDLPHHILCEIQMNPDTYMKLPEGDMELFKMWCDDFKLTEYDSEINALLANCPRMRALYQELVPEKIENLVFWTRYFYKVRQMELLIRCKVDAEKQLLQDDENEMTKLQERAIDFEKKNLDFDSIESSNTESTQSQNSSDRRSTMDESWSLCSSTNADIQELHDDDGPRTPTAGLNSSSSKSDRWINGDE